MNVHLIIKVVQVFDKKPLVLNVKIDYSKTTFIFGPTDQIPCSKGLFWGVIVASPKTHPRGDIQGAQKMNWHRGQD